MEEPGGVRRAVGDELTMLAADGHCLDSHVAILVSTRMHLATVLLGWWGQTVSSTAMSKRAACGFAILDFWRLIECE